MPFGGRFPIIYKNLVVILLSGATSRKQPTFQRRQTVWWSQFEATGGQLSASGEIISLSPSSQDHLCLFVSRFFLSLFLRVIFVFFFWRSFPSLRSFKVLTGNLTQTIRQTLDPGTGEDLPNYTPDADPADCRADNLLDSYEKVFFSCMSVCLVWRWLLTFVMKVIDHTYSRGSREEITTSVDIGIATECLAECTRLGSQCLAVTLQVGISGFES